MMEAGVPTSRNAHTFPDVAQLTEPRSKKGQLSPSAAKPSLDFHGKESGALADRQLEGFTKDHHIPIGGTVHESCESYFINVCSEMSPRKGAWLPQSRFKTESVVEGDAAHTNKMREFRVKRP